MDPDRSYLTRYLVGDQRRKKKEKLVDSGELHSPGMWALCLVVLCVGSDRARVFSCGGLFPSSVFCTH